MRNEGIFNEVVDDALYEELQRSLDKSVGVLSEIFKREKEIKELNYYLIEKSSEYGHVHTCPMKIIIEAYEEYARNSIDY